jgi:hypothetical protein
MNNEQCISSYTFRLTGHLLLQFRTGLPDEQREFEHLLTKAEKETTRTRRFRST